MSLPVATLAWLRQAKDDTEVAADILCRTPSGGIGGDHPSIAAAREQAIESVGRLLSAYHQAIGGERCQ